MIHHITRATRHLIFWSLIAAAIGLTGVRLLLSGIEHYKSELAVNIGARVGTPVTIGRLGAKMRGFNPELVLKDIAISSVVSKLQSGSEKPAIQFNEVRLGVNLLDMLVNRDVLSSSWVTLVGAKLSVKRQQDGSIVIVGLKTGDGQPLWLLQGGKYELLQSEIGWQDEISHSRPILFNGVDLALRNDGDRHRLNVLMRLPEKIGDTLRVSMEFTGNVFEPETVQGRVYIDGRAILLPELAALGMQFAQLAPEDRIHFNSGSGDVKIWGDLRQAQLVAADVDAQIRQMALARHGQPDFSVKDLQTRMHWQAPDSVNKEWRLDVHDFSLETQDNAKSAGKKWPDAVFSVSGQRTDDQIWHKLALYIERLDLQEISGLIRFFSPSANKQADLLTQAQLKGTLENFALFADLDAKALALNGSFNNIGIASLAVVPGIENLSGKIKGDQTQGEIALATLGARLAAPGLFREALPVDRMQGTLSWRQADDHAWSISSPGIELNSLSFSSRTKFRIDMPGQGKPVFMDLQAAFGGDDVSQVKHYLPVGIMDADVVSWLDRAFVSGRMTDAGVLFYGNLDDFPFTKAPGVFEAVFHGDQFDLDYAPDWPHITGMNADVMFSQAGLTVNVTHGQSGGVSNSAEKPTALVTIKQAEVTIPSLNNSEHVLIKGEAEGDIAHVLAFMQQTPLSSPVNSLLGAITPQGNTQVALDLKIPLTEAAPTKVDGGAQLKDAKLTVKALDLPVSKINGELKFNEQGVYSDSIQATALGHPIQVNIKSSDSQTTVNVDGEVGVDDLKAQFDLPWWHIADGATDYRLSLTLPYGYATPELSVESELSGVSLDLPESLAKTREQKMPSSITFSLNDERLLPAQVKYDNKLKAALQLDTVNRGVYSGHVLIGNGDVAQIQDSGIKLEINRDRLPLQDWLGLASAQGAGDSVKEVKIHSDHALWKNNDIGLADLNLKRSGDYWNGVVINPIASGKLQIPAAFNSTDRITLNMDRLDLSALKQAKAKDANAGPMLSPEQMPLLTLTSAKTLWQSIDLGRLSLETARITGGMAFKSVELTGDKQKLLLSGDWVASGKHATTHARGYLEVPRAGSLLAELGLTKDLSETSAVADFNVRWDGAPHQFALAGLNGDLDLKLKNGRILSIEPGFGRVLGILAMAQWLKRAQLDFSDIYQEGLTFDSIKGHFDLVNGVAKTQDLIVDAVPAKIAIKGDTNLVSQTVDQVVNVTPKSADAVPIAGTIMGKVAALVGRSLTGKDQEGFFFGSQYLVKGSWSNAEVIPMHKNDGLLQKTWTGITEFPWLRQQE
ncbi:MAG: YhdP family protein [Methylobacter sp.]